MTSSGPSWPPPGGPADSTHQAAAGSGHWNTVPGGGIPPVTSFAGGPGDRPSRRRQGLVATAVIGGLFVVGMVAGGLILIVRDRDPGTGPTVTTALAGPEGSASTLPGTGDRIGTTVAGIGIRAGDCINYRHTGNIAEFHIVSCDDPHRAEVTARMEHPSAGQDFPGIDELSRWSADRCREASNGFVGADVFDTTLVETTLVPDFDDWSNGDYRVACIVAAYDGSNLVGSVEGRAAAHSRGTTVEVQRLKPGDCFSPVGGETSLELAEETLVTLTTCAARATGLFFGRGPVAYDSGRPYPGDAAVRDAAIAVCDEQFHRWFGVPATGFNYTFWSPDDTLWTLDHRMALCAVTDDAGLPANLDLASYVPLIDLAVGACFDLAASETIETQAIDDRVLPTSCTVGHDGQVVGTGSLTATGDPYPSDDTLDGQVAAACTTDFGAYVGGAPGDVVTDEVGVIYWWPTLDGWEQGDLRYMCAIVSDGVPLTASYEGALG